MIQRILMIGVAAFALAACSEQPQDMASGKKPDVPAWNGANDNGYVAPGWQAGDQKAWEAQLKQRAAGQNESVRIGSNT